MSTRIDITSDLTRDSSPSNPHTHELYADIFRPGKLFLYLPGAEFTATHEGVTVAIPVEVWEEIRKFGAEKAEGCWEP
jgi:hypothetical protein